MVQISDWRRPRANADRRSLGDGVIPSAEIFAAVRRTGYAGPYVLEIFSEESLPDSLWRGDIAASLRRNADAFAALVLRGARHDGAVSGMSGRSASRNSAGARSTRSGWPASREWSTTTGRAAASARFRFATLRA